MIVFSDNHLISVGLLSNSCNDFSLKVYRKCTDIELSAFLHKTGLFVYRVSLEVDSDKAEDSNGFIEFRNCGSNMIDLYLLLMLKSRYKQERPAMTFSREVLWDISSYLDVSIDLPFIP